MLIYSTSLPDFRADYLRVSTSIVMLGDYVFKLFDTLNEFSPLNDFFAFNYLSVKPNLDYVSYVP